MACRDLESTILLLHVFPIAAAAAAAAESVPRGVDRRGTDRRFLDGDDYDDVDVENEGRPRLIPENNCRPCYL